MSSRSFVLWLCLGVIFDFFLFFGVLQGGTFPLDVSGFFAFIANYLRALGGVSSSVVAPSWFKIFLFLFEEFVESPRE